MSTELFVRGTAVAAPSRRRWTGIVLAAVVIVVTVLVSYDPPSSGTPFDPLARDDLGLAVTVDVLDELGVEVEVVDELPDAASVDAVLAPPLGWGDAELVGLASAGTRVVAALPPHPEATAAELAFTGIGLVTREVDCDLLADVDRVRSPSWQGWLTPAGELPPGSELCITDGALAWATVLPVGDGELVALGTFAPLVNARMREPDAAVMAVRLLDVAAGDRVAALTVPGGADDQPTLLDLVDRRWFDAAWLSLFALVVAVLSRGRRLGRPVGEQLPVRVPSGELARALGDLRHRAGADAAAAEQLRVRTIDAIGVALGLGPSPDAEEAVRAAVVAGVDLDGADADALRGPPPRDLDRDGLAAVATRYAAIRERVRHGRRRAGEPPDGSRGATTGPLDLPHATDDQPEQP